MDDATWFAVEDGVQIHGIDALHTALLFEPYHTHFLGYIPPTRSIDKTHNYVVIHHCDNRTPPAFMVAVYEDEDAPHTDMKLSLARDPDYVIANSTILGAIMALGHAGSRPHDLWMQMPPAGTLITHVR